MRVKERLNRRWSTTVKLFILTVIVVALTSSLTSKVKEEVVEKDLLYSENLRLSAQVKQQRTKNIELVENYEVLLVKHEDTRNKLDETRIELKKKVLINLSMAKEDKTDRVFSTLAEDKDDIKILERIVEAEATGATIEQKINVCWTIFNRVDVDSFPNSIKKVVFQKIGGKHQFSPISDKRYYSVSITDSTKEAVQRALDGEGTHEGLYFMARKSAKSSNVTWFDRALKRLFNDGIHEYYSEKE